MIRKVHCSLALMFLTALALYSQQANLGGIVGTVRDTSGAVVPAAHVVAVNEGTSVRHEATTNEDGGFLFTALQVGAYTVTVTGSGFKTTVRTGVAVLSGQNSTLEVQLTVGEVSQTVNVNASNVEIDTTSTNMGTTRTLEELEQLPVGISGSGSREAAGFIKTIAGAAEV